MNKNQFAAFLGITPQYLCTIESGENCLSVEKIVLLARKANVSTDYILMGKNDIVNENMIKNVMNINQEQLDSYFSIIKNLIELTKKVS